MRCNLLYIFTFVPPNPKKIEALRSCGALNRNPQKVCHPLFTGNDFFDPHDLVQLKYETIRAVEVDGPSDRSGIRGFWPLAAHYL